MKFFRKTKSIIRVFSSLLNQSKNLRKNYPAVKSEDELISKYYATESSKTISLDLGCGKYPRNPFKASELFGIDIQGGLEGNIIQADLSEAPIPFNDDMFDFCTAYDFIEHIPRLSWPEGKPRLAFIQLMNEIYRVLKPGGILMHVTPAFPSKEVFQDPTHVNVITEDTMPRYFCEPYNSAKKSGYGFNGSFQLIEQKWRDSAWLVGFMKAVK